MDYHTHNSHYNPVVYDLKPLFRAAGIIPPEPGCVTLYDRMEIPEENPYDEWITLGLATLRKLGEQEFSPQRVADVGTGNGILALGMAYLFKPTTIYLTDIIEEVLEPSRQNIMMNSIPLLDQGYVPDLVLSMGRDAEPLPDYGLDLVTFSPPPLMVDDAHALEHGLARTTLIERDYYARYAQGEDDPLLKWSVLPWYCFLTAVKQKLTAHGKIVGLYSGRIPFPVIAEAHARANLALDVAYSIVKKQQDPLYLQHYAQYEATFLHGDTFDFYHYQKAHSLMEAQQLPMPGISTKTDAELKEILRPARISAREAYAQAQQGKPVAHIGHALVSSR